MKIMINLRLTYVNFYYMIALSKVNAKIHMIFILRKIFREV